MKVSIYLDVQDSDGFVYIAGVTTDNPVTGQKTISGGWGAPHKRFRIMMDLPEVHRVHRIDVAQEAIEDISARDKTEGV